MPKNINLIGQRFGKLTVLARDFDDPRNKTQKASFWKCRCDCGNIKTISYNSLTRGQTLSCGCLLTQPHKTIDDLSGRRFGHILVLERDYTYRKEHNIKRYSTYWKCQCDCGNIFSTTRDRLLSKHIQSCGCLVSKGEQKITAFYQIIELILKHNIVFQILYYLQAVCHVLIMLFLISTKNQYF